MNEPIDAVQLNTALTSIRENLGKIKERAHSYSSVSLSGTGYVRGPEIIEKIAEIERVHSVCNEKSTNE